MKQILLSALLCLFVISANAGVSTGNVSANSSEITAPNSPQDVMQDVMQDVVYLKNGKVIRGTIIENTLNGNVSILAVGGEIQNYTMAEIDRITKEKIALDTEVLTFSTNDKGYGGFVDFGYTFGMGTNGMSSMEATTSHGYQFSDKLFLGAGAGAHLYSEGVDNIIIIPVFVDARYNISSGKIIPFVGLKAGYSIGLTDAITAGSTSGLYVAPTVGVKYRMTRRMALNLTLGYTAQYVDYQYSVGAKIFDRDGNIGGFSIKFGLEF